jgi:phosphatidylinositol 4-kinase A
VRKSILYTSNTSCNYSWFLAKFGPERTLAYRNGCKEFVKSLAAYSLIMFILQFKDRHNGNIMFDREGHMIHIGNLFDN